MTARKLVSRVLQFARIHFNDHANLVRPLALHPIIFVSLLTDKTQTRFIHGNKKQTSCKRQFLEREAFVLDSLDVRDST